MIYYFVVTFVSNLHFKILITFNFSLSLSFSSIIKSSKSGGKSFNFISYNKKYTNIFIEIVLNINQGRLKGTSV